MLRVDPLRQGRALLLALLLGFAAGLLYDLLRPARWRCGRVAALLPDTLFCLALGAAFFLYAMTAGEGRLGVGALAASWLGFLAWNRLLSPRMLPLFVKTFQYLDIIPRYAKKIFKKRKNTQKSTLKK